MSCDAAISVVELSKCYTVYDAPQDRLKQAIMPRLARAAAPFARRIGRDIVPPVFFRHHWALREISFEIARGETLGVIGRNGAGKSTLLQLICGTLAPTSGRVDLNGRVGALLELGSGFNPEFTGRENVFLNATVLGLTTREIEDRLDDIIAFADIGPYIDQPTKTYSSGMAMRLAFAVIAHIDADVLIIDEALAVGDAYFQQKCLRWMRRFRERGTILFCGHDTAAVITLCHHALWLDRGAVQAYGDAKEVVEAYGASIYAQSGGMANEDAAPRPARAASRAQDRREPAGVEPAAGEPDANLAVPRSGAVFEFNEGSAGFGTGEATILHASMNAADGSELTWIAGGEAVEVKARIKANAAIHDPIIGFHIKDRLGQPLVGDNTFLTYQSQALSFAAGDEIEARFVFELPHLRSGDYSVTLAVASGTLDQHVQHHWLHDAFFFKVHSPFQNGVMIAIPMRSITVTTVASRSDGSAGMAPAPATPAAVAVAG
jgi:homopolymeric O-antigen transport system ATP-binding protein